MDGEPSPVPAVVLAPTLVGIHHLNLGTDGALV